MVSSPSVPRSPSLWPVTRAIRSSARRSRIACNCSFAGPPFACASPVVPGRNALHAAMPADSSCSSPSATPACKCSRKTRLDQTPLRRRIDRPLVFPSRTASRISRWGSAATPVAGQLGMPACISLALTHAASRIIIVAIIIIIIIGDCNIPMWTIAR